MPQDPCHEARAWPQTGHFRADGKTAGVRLMESAARPLFSVILATRNRPALFAVALQSVLDQRFRDIEVIAVNDGSTEPHASQYRDLRQMTDGRVRSLSLPLTGRGHGPAYAANFGAASARGGYLCFLDDDDQWTDDGHLQRVASLIEADSGSIDLILANQRAFLNGSPITSVIWIESLEKMLAPKPDACMAYTVTLDALLQCQSHCHLNTTIIREDFFNSIGGFDNELRYEQDKEFYFRAIDQASSIRFLPQFVSRHNIPDPAARKSASTSESELSKRLYQLRVLDKTALFSKRPELRRYAMQHRAYALQHIADAAARAGRPACARYYARSALAAQFWPGWLSSRLRQVTRRVIGPR